MTRSVETDTIFKGVIQADNEPVNDKDLVTKQYADQLDISKSVEGTGLLYLENEIISTKELATDPVTQDLTIEEIDNTWLIKLVQSKIDINNLEKIAGNFWVDVFSAINAIIDVDPVVKKNKQKDEIIKILLSYITNDYAGSAGKVLACLGNVTKPFDFVSLSLFTPFSPRHRAGFEVEYYSTTQLKVKKGVARNLADTGNLVTTVDKYLDTTLVNTEGGFMQSDILTGVVYTSPNLTISSINTTTDVITTSTNHGFPSNTNNPQPVIFATSTGSLPTAVPVIVVGTVYWARYVAVNQFTLHPTRADAIANTNIINFSNAGSGNSFDGNYVIGHNTQFNTEGNNKLDYGDVIAITGSNNYYIDSVTSDSVIKLLQTATAVINEATHKRGGKVSSGFVGFYQIYAISKGVDSSTTSVVMGNIKDIARVGDGTYSQYRELYGFCKIKSNGNLTKFRYKPKDDFYEIDESDLKFGYSVSFDMTIANNSHVVYNSTVTGTPKISSLKKWLPKTAIQAELGITTADMYRLVVRELGAVHEICENSTYWYDMGRKKVFVGDSKQIESYTKNSSGTCVIVVIGGCLGGIE